jgi:hypothetical protein
MRHVYPPDVANEVRARLEAQPNMFMQSLDVARGFRTPVDPSAEELERLLEVTFFASLTSEESRSEPLSIVYSPNGLADLELLARPWVVAGWNAMQFTYTRLRKLASLSKPGSAYLVISSGVEGLEIRGVANPPPPQFLDFDDKFLRISAIAPGTLIVEEGSHEVLTYAAGVIHNARTEPGDKEDSPFSTIRHALATGAHGSAEFFLRRLVRLIAGSGHGGMIAIGADDSDAEAIPSEQAYRLHAPLDLGGLFVKTWELSEVSNHLAQRRLGPDYEEMQPESEEERLNNRELHDESQKLEAVSEQLARFSTVDGALAMTPALQLVAFGCKLNVKEDPTNVWRYKGVLQAERLDLSQKGTRHRSAAAFAAEKRGRLAICVSQDGPVTVFGTWRGDIYSWTMNVGYAWSPSWFW